ncbi:MAG: F420-dependent NADP oxidoreductase [Bacteroidia bacterium]
MKKTTHSIVFIGSGNVATHLALALKKAGHRIIQVYSQHLEHADALAKLVKAQSIDSIELIDKMADIYIVAVKDDAIEVVVKQLQLSDKIVAHTSGSIDMKALKNASKNYGVFYPLQTFSKNKKVDFKTVPICLEANNSDTFTVLLNLAQISTNVQSINSKQRKSIHLAAVFACNFSNHLYAIADTILQKNKLSLELLKPLIEETAQKIKTTAPVLAQTGPAVRNDKKIMKNHLEMLSSNSDYQKIYELLSKSIQKQRKKKK